MLLKVILILIIALLFFPVKYKVILDKELKMYFTIFFILKINLNYIIVANKFITQRIKRSASFSEIMENTMKVINSRYIIYDFLKLSTLSRFHLSLQLPIDKFEYHPYLYTTLSSGKEFIKYWIDNRFKNSYDTKISFTETSENDINVYFHSIVSTRLVNIIFIALKYFKKIPILLKRFT